MSPEEYEQKKRDSMERLSDETLDWIKTFDVARMFLRSESWVRKIKREGKIPPYALPVKVFPGQRGWFWSKRAVERWRDELLEENEKKESERKTESE